MKYICERCNKPIETDHIQGDGIFACPNCGYAYLKDVIGNGDIHSVHKYINPNVWGTCDDYGNKFVEHYKQE